MEWTDVETKERLLLDDEPSVTSAADESSQQSSGGGGAPPNALCYCERERDVRQVELQCCRCLKWFHKQCVTSAVGRCLPFMTCYTFWCRDCGADSVEAFSRRQTNFSQMCETAIANLMVGAEDDGNRVSFSKDREIIPFIDANWEVLTTMPRRIKHTWHQTVVKTMTKETDTFIHDARDPNDPHFALRNQDLLRIGPNYDSARIDPTGGVPNRFGGRGAKRRFEPSEALAAKRQKSELSSPKLPPNGFPAEFPFNKDGYRYVLAEPDPHGPFRQEFEESQDLAGKPIPGWLCRKLMPDWVALSLHDRATQLKISEDRRTVCGEKGYCMVRANYGVRRGLWFFEVRVEDMPDGAAVRLGVAQELANIQAPLGYDKFGYSVRSRKGTKFHDSRGQHFADSGFGAGDVIGFLLELPDGADSALLNTYKDKPLVKFKSYLYFEEKDDIPKQTRELRPLADSRLTVFKNGRPLGTAFHDLYAGTYYPSASLYKSASVSFNFGPKFEFPPKGRAFDAMSAVVATQQTEQTLSDVLYFVENEGRLRLDIFYGGN